MTERIRINKLKLDATLSGKPVIHLHAPGAQYSRFPVLYLFDPGLLVQAGIDPNSLGEDPIHVNLWAHYETSEKLNSRGNPYKDIVSLERIDALATTTSTDNSAVLAELRAIKALLLDLATDSQPLATEQTKRIHALNRAGRTGSAADPQAPPQVGQATTPEPEPELTEREAMMEFHGLVGPAIAEGRLQTTVANDLSQAAGNGGQGWIAALASLRELLAT